MSEKKQWNVISHAVCLRKVRGSGTIGPGIPRAADVCHWVTWTWPRSLQFSCWVEKRRRRRCRERKLVRLFLVPRRPFLPQATTSGPRRSQWVKRTEIDPFARNNLSPTIFNHTTRETFDVSFQRSYNKRKVFFLSHIWVTHIWLKR